MENEVLLDLQAVAKKLNISTPTVKNLIEAGELEAINLGMAKHKIYRISQESYNKFIKKRGLKSVPKPNINKPERKHAFAGA